MAGSQYTVQLPLPQRKPQGAPLKPIPPPRPSLPQLPPPLPPRRERKQHHIIQPGGLRLPVLQFQKTNAERSKPDIFRFSKPDTTDCPRSSVNPQRGTLPYAFSNKSSYLAPRHATGHGYPNSGPSPTPSQSPLTPYNPAQRPTRPSPSPPQHMAPPPPGAQRISHTSSDEDPYLIPRLPTGPGYPNSDPSPSPSQSPVTPYNPAQSPTRPSPSPPNYVPPPLPDAQRTSHAFGDEDPYLIPRLPTSHGYPNSDPAPTPSQSPVTPYKPAKSPTLPSPSPNYMAPPPPGEPSMISQKIAASRFGSPKNSFQQLPKDPYVGSVNVISLNPDNFSEIIADKDFAMVMFYNPYDTKSVAPKDNFKKAANNRRYLSHMFAAINCDDHAPFCSSLDVETLPMFKLFSSGKVIAVFRDTAGFGEKTMRHYMETLASIAQIGGCKVNKLSPDLPTVARKRCFLAKLLGFKK